MRRLIRRLNEWEREHWREVEFAIVWTLALVLAALLISEALARF